ncbi:MAG: ABC transporter ATP-binding protein, partial [Bacteroidota bacterium]
MTLALHHFTKSYNGIEVLSIPHLQLGPGVYWIKGENGSGKSTLFKSIAGLLPHQGDITIGDKNVKKHPFEYRKLVSYSEAEPLYPGFLTAKDLVRFIGKTRHASREQQQHLSERFGLPSFFEKTAETYSSGMMKKLSLALAFLGTPHVIILDEPLITLDEHARDVLFSVINDTMKQRDIIF